ncbi:hypothetical protein J2Z22_001343 [Paenibacillus forsythiae]|uniref:Uncharacterized protein n=1 Tax=Paenibacillus forsythiae TaxID=365616 RepID=A0ABU3H4T6_9BACL|nr:hypothetical protein [Paenibacillus forsythiae]
MTTTVSARVVRLLGLNVLSLNPWIRPREEVISTAFFAKSDMTFASVYLCFCVPFSSAACNYEYTPWLALFVIVRT